MGLKQRGLQLKLFAALKAYQVTSADVDTHEQDKIIESGLKALSVAFHKLLDVLYNTVMDLFGGIIYLHKHIWLCKVNERLDLYFSSRSKALTIVN